MKPVVHRLVWRAAAGLSALGVLWAAVGVGAGPAPQADTGGEPPAALVEATLAVPTNTKARADAVSGDHADPGGASRWASRLAPGLQGRSGDLWSQLQALGRECGGLMPSHCLSGVLAALPDAERARMSDILERLPRLAPRLSALVMSSQQPMLERIEAVSQVRADVMGADNARLLFGREEAQFRDEARWAQFLANEAARMPLAERLAAAESMRSPEAGPLGDATERARRYERTLQLTLLDARDDADRQRLAREVRAQFFTADLARQMEQGDRFDAAQRERMAQYARQKQAIQARYAGVADVTALQQRDAELAALREQVFPDSFQAH
ncbi:lipase secretion chaperone [Ideonella sp. DXS29W]|uniref:Lipase helper protein n=1 Tax=Ideonella lacteola TaxID=2984193 RepID=A0ABU9BXX8_9BURK